MQRQQYESAYENGFYAKLEKHTAGAVAKHLYMQVKKRKRHIGKAHVF